jgi:hypothetical protein
VTIDEYGIDDKRDKSQGIKRAISGFRIKNSEMVVPSEMIIVCLASIRICAAGLKYPTEKCRNRHRRSGDRDLREEICEAIKSKHLLVLMDP